MDSTRFDSLVRALARPASRRGAVGVMVGALALLGEVAPGVAGRRGGGQKCPTKADKQTCAQWCASTFGASTPEAKRCINEAAKCQGLCYSRCGQLDGPHFERKLCGTECVELGTNKNCTDCDDVCTAPATCLQDGCCTPTTCDALGATCGKPSDDCGGKLDCGTCDERECLTCISNTCTSTCGGKTPDCNGRGECICNATSCPSGQICEDGNCRFPPDHHPFACKCNDHSQGWQTSCEQIDCTREALRTVCDRLCANLRGPSAEASCGFATCTP
jgi:hypothetical protein